MGLVAPPNGSGGIVRLLALRLGPEHVHRHGREREHIA
jgi:hypothetical protein